MFNFIKTYTMSFLNQTPKEPLNNIVSPVVITNKDIQQSINTARNNMLKRKGLFPPVETSAELKTLEKNSECDYIMSLINTTILSAVEREKEHVGTHIDHKRLKHLRFESFTTCEKFMTYKKYLNEAGVNIYVYKNNKDINEVEYRILDNTLNVFH